MCEGSCAIIERIPAEKYKHAASPRSFKATSGVRTSGSSEVQPFISVRAERTAAGQRPRARAPGAPPRAPPPLAARARPLGTRASRLRRAARWVYAALGGRAAAAPRGWVGSRRNCERRGRGGRAMVAASGPRAATR